MNKLPIRNYRDLINDLALDFKFRYVPFRGYYRYRSYKYKRKDIEMGLLQFLCSPTKASNPISMSTVMTLEPGDIIATGTSSGVGVKMKPRGYMKAGDVVRVEIEKIGVLENPVIEEPADTAFIN